MRRRGFTVAEALITLVLVGMLFAVVGTLVGSLSRTLNRSKQRDRSIDAEMVALEVVSRDLSSAIVVAQPASTTSTPQVQLVRLARGVTRLPPVRPSPGPGTWSPHAVADRATIRYFVYGTQLVREVVVPGLTTTEIVTDNIYGLSSRRTSGDPNLVQVTASTLFDGQVRTLTTLVPVHPPGQIVP